MTLVATEEEVRLDRRTNEGDRESPITLRAEQKRSPSSPRGRVWVSRNPHVSANTNLEGRIWSRLHLAVARWGGSPSPLPFVPVLEMTNNNATFLRLATARRAWPHTPTCSEGVSVMPPCHPHGARGSF